MCACVYGAGGVYVLLTFPVSVLSGDATNQPFSSVHCHSHLLVILNPPFSASINICFTASTLSHHVVNPPSLQFTPKKSPFTPVSGPPYHLTSLSIVPKVSLISFSNGLDERPFAILNKSYPGFLWWLSNYLGNSFN